MIRNHRLIILIYIVLSVALSYGLSFASDTSEMTVIAYKIDGLPENATNEVKCSYLIGTATLKKLDEYKLPEQINNYFTSSEVIILEVSSLSGSIDPNEINDFMLPNFNLEKLYRPDIWTKLKARCEKIGITLEYMPFKPFVIAIMLVERNTQKSGKESFDQYIYNLAKKKAKSIKFLETSVSYLFDKMPLEAQVLLVEKVIEDTGELALESAAIERSYLSGNFDEIEKATRIVSKNGLIAEAEKIMQRILIDERSAFWMPVIEDNVQKGGAFIAVHIANLIGKDGVVEKLRKKGYRIKDVSIINKEYLK